MIDIDKAFEGRWRIKGKFIEDGIILFDSQKGVSEAIKELCRDFFEAGMELSEPQGEHIMITAGGEIISKISKREEVFRDSVTTPENISKYGTQMLQDFCDYWTEPNKSKTKMRFELQQTFEVNRRLATWARNNFNRYDRQQHITCDERNRQKLTDILVG